MLPNIKMKYKNYFFSVLKKEYLNYIKDLPSVKSNINVMAGSSLQHFYNSSTSYNSNVPIISDSSSQEYVRDTIIDKGEYYLESYFGRLNYTFDNRFLFGITINIFE